MIIVDMPIGIPDFDIDNLSDACVLTLTAMARVNGVAQRLGAGEYDATGLQMAIWG